MTVHEALPKRLAAESSKTAKVRQKLGQHWKELEQKITPKALQETKEEIHRWIARHADMRVSLKNKTIALFDSNQNAAKISQRVSSILDRLREDLQRFN